MTSYEQKLAWLTANGYMKDINGEPMLSSEAVALLAGVTVPDIRNSITEASTLSTDLMARMRANAARLKQKHHSTNLVDILYGEAAFD